MGNICSRRHASKLWSRAPQEEKVSRLSPMMEVYGVFIARFIQMIHDQILLKNRKLSFVVLDLRFPNSDPERLVAVTASLADSRNQNEMLKKLNPVERSACERLSWAIFFDFVEERFQVEEELERFRLELVSKVNRGRLSVDHIVTNANPSKDPDMRLIRFQLKFLDFK